MIIRNDRYFIVDGALNRRHYWSQELYPPWAALSNLQFLPDQRAGAGVEPHYHDNDEIWLFLSGHGEVWLDGQSFAITPNTLVYTPMGAVHRFQMFADFANAPAVTRLERAKRPLHLLTDEHGAPQRTAPGFVIPGKDNLGPFLDRGPRCPLTELRAMTLTAGERIAEAQLAQTEYWVSLDGMVNVGVDGLEVELAPGDVAVLRAGAVRWAGSKAGGRVALARE